jgi:hypothetical protein
MRAGIETPKFVFENIRLADKFFWKTGRFMMKRNRFLIGMTRLMLTLVMTGCDSATSGAAQKVLQGMTSYTIVLANIVNSATYTAVVYDSGEAVGSSEALAENGSASIRLTPYNGKPAFSERTYQVQVTSGGDVKEAAYVAFVANGNTPLDWSTMTVISEKTDEKGETLELIITGASDALNVSANVASTPVFAYTPKTGDTYVIKMNGVVISRGTVKVTADVAWEFKSESFTFTATVKEDGLKFAGKITDEIDVDKLTELILTIESGNTDNDDTGTTPLLTPSPALPRLLPT